LAGGKSKLQLSQVETSPYLQTSPLWQLDDMDMSDTRHRGEVEAFGDHDGWYARDDSGIVVVRCGEKREEVQ
jgi:hypothetical protein